MRYVFMREDVQIPYDGIEVLKDTPKRTSVRDRSSREFALNGACVPGGARLAKATAGDGHQRRRTPRAPITPSMGVDGSVTCVHSGPLSER
jgi:hypothetical protein